MIKEEKLEQEIYTKFKLVLNVETWLTFVCGELGNTTWLTGNKWKVAKKIWKWHWFFDFFEHAESYILLHFNLAILMVPDGGGGVTCWTPCGREKIENSWLVKKHQVATNPIQKDM